MTKGAIYSNFSSKAELLLAAMGAKGLTLSSPRPPATTLREELAATAAALQQLVRRAKGEETFLAEFHLYALGDPEIRKGLAATYAEGFAGTAAYLSRLPAQGRRRRRGIWRWRCSASRWASCCSRS